MSFHHFIPRKVHRRTFFKKYFSRQMLQEGIEICRLCHNGLHKFYSEMELAKDFSSLEKITADPKLRNHFQWVSKQRVQ